MYILKEFYRLGFASETFCSKKILVLLIILILKNVSFSYLSSTIGIIIMSLQRFEIQNSNVI